MARRIAALAASLTLAGISFTGHVQGVRSDAADVSDTIDFTGTATVTSDNDNDSPPAIDLIGGAGTYVFSSTQCQLVSGINPDIPDPLPIPETATCNMGASGNYTNTACGPGFTGTLTGMASINSSIENITATFTITFIAGVPGRFTTGSATTKGPDDQTADTEPINKTDSSASITPAAKAQVLDTGDCTATFTLTGHIVLDESMATGS